MKPLDDWMILEKEEVQLKEGLILPETAKEKLVEAGDIFVAKVLGPDAEKRVKVGDRCLFCGLGAVVHVKLPSGVTFWTGRAEDVKWILEKGE